LVSEIATHLRKVLNIGHKCVKITYILEK